MLLSAESLTCRTAIPAIMLGMLVLAVSCGGGPAGVSAVPVPSAAAPSVALVTTPTPPATFSSSIPAAAPTSSAGGAAPRREVLAQNLASPDDLALAPGGTIYISDVGDGTISRHAPDGQMATILAGLSEPEGIVVLPDGTLLIAEQGKNRIVRYDPTTRSLALFLSLENKMGQAGVDGITLDAHIPGQPTVIIPDSPNGTLLRASLDGKTVHEIARGFVRPTGAWVEKDGSILVADEFGHAVKRVGPDGRVEAVAALPTPDDVVADEAGNIFASTLGDGAIHRIDATTGKASIVVAGLASPQGLNFDADGNLVVTDPGHRRLVKVILH